MIVSLVIVLLLACPWIVPALCARHRQSGIYVVNETAVEGLVPDPGGLPPRTREPSGHLRRAKAEGAGRFTVAARDFDAQMRELRRITSR